MSKRSEERLVFMKLVVFFRSEVPKYNQRLGSEKDGEEYIGKNKK